MCSTKITEFGYVKFTKSISSKDGVWREFLQISSNNTFSKNEYFKNVDFFIICSVNKLLKRDCHKTNLFFIHIFKIMGSHL